MFHHSSPSMKKILFSRQYPKIKLALLTIIITIGYHYVNKESKRQKVDKNSTHKYSNEETKEKKTENEQSKTYDYNDFEKDPDPESLNENGFDKDAKLIHPSWIVEYLRDIRGRNQPIHVPRAPKALILESRNNILNLSDLVDVESLRKLWNLVRSDGFFYNLYAGFREYIGVGDQNIVVFGIKLMAKAGGKLICNMFKDAGVHFKNTLLGKFNEFKDMIGDSCYMVYREQVVGLQVLKTMITNFIGGTNEAGLWQKTKSMPMKVVNGISKGCSSLYNKITGKKNETVSGEVPLPQQTENTPTDNLNDNMPSVNATTDNLPIDDLATENELTNNLAINNLITDNLQTNVVDPWYVRTYKWCKKKLFGESEPERLPTIVEEVKEEEEAKEEEASSYHTPKNSSDVEFYSADENLNEEV